MTIRSLTRSPAGFTIVELLITLTLLSVVLAALTGVVLSLQRGYVVQRERARAQESMRAARMTIATVLRGAAADPQSAGQSLLDPDPLSHGTFDNVRVVSDFNPADGDVIDQLEDVQLWVDQDTLFVHWQAAATPQALAYPITTLSFHYYANDGTELTTASQVVGATRVKFIIEAPRDAYSGAVERIESWWVHLRNR